MEDIKCCLLGLESSAFYFVHHTESQLTGPHAAPPSASSSSSLDSDSGEVEDSTTFSADVPSPVYASTTVPEEGGERSIRSHGSCSTASNERKLKEKVAEPDAKGVGGKRSGIKSGKKAPAHEGPIEGDWGLCSSQSGSAGQPRMVLNASYRSLLHPTEVDLLTQLIPLGSMYPLLANTNRKTLLSGGLYRSAVATGIRQLLHTYYIPDIQRLQNPFEAHLLRSKYFLTFELLCGMVKDWSGEAVAGAQKTTSASLLLPLLQRFLTHQEVPQAFRQLMGACVWSAVLYGIAHYVSHGVVLHSCKEDFFVSVESCARHHHSEGVQRERVERESRMSGEARYVLHEDRLPSGISRELGLKILMAGRERQRLLSAKPMLPPAVRRRRRRGEIGKEDTINEKTGFHLLPSHHDHWLEELSREAEDDTSQAVFKTIFSQTLWEGGVLHVGEFTARVHNVYVLWSKTLWQQIIQPTHFLSTKSSATKADEPVIDKGGRSPFETQLVQLQEIFFLLRGDVRSTFIQSILPLLFHLSSRRELDEGDQVKRPSRFVHSVEEGGTPESRSGEDEWEDEERNHLRETQALTDESPPGSLFPSSHFSAVTLHRRFAVQEAFRSALHICALFPHSTHHKSPSVYYEGEADGGETDMFRVILSEKASSHERQGGAHAGDSSASIEVGAKIVLHRVRSIQLEYSPEARFSSSPYFSAPGGHSFPIAPWENSLGSIGLVISPSAFQCYQFVFQFLLQISVAIEGLQSLRSTFSEALSIVNRQPSKAVRAALSLCHLTLFLLTTVRQYLHVDIIHPACVELRSRMLGSDEGEEVKVGGRSVYRCASVEEAQRLHTTFLRTIMEGSFFPPEAVASTASPSAPVDTNEGLPQGSETSNRDAGPLHTTEDHTASEAPLHDAILSLCECAFAFVLLCKRYPITSWAVKTSANSPPHPQVLACLEALEAQLQQRVMAVFVAYLRHSRHPTDRQLWTRLDFSKFFSNLYAEPVGTPPPLPTEAPRPSVPHPADPADRPHHSPSIAEHQLLLLQTLQAEQRQAQREYLEKETVKPQRRRLLPPSSLPHSSSANAGSGLNRTPRKLSAPPISSNRSRSKQASKLTSHPPREEPTTKARNVAESSKQRQTERALSTGKHIGTTPARNPRGTTPTRDAFAEKKPETLAATPSPLRAGTARDVFVDPLLWDCGEEAQRLTPSAHATAPESASASVVSPNLELHRRSSRRFYDHGRRQLSLDDEDYVVQKGDNPEG